MNSKRAKEEANPSHIFGEKIKADGIRHVVNVTLQTAKQFENCNSLYVHYVVEAPPGKQLNIVVGIGHVIDS